MNNTKTKADDTDTSETYAGEMQRDSLLPNGMSYLQKKETHLAQASCPFSSHCLSVRPSPAHIALPESILSLGRDVIAKGHSSVEEFRGSS